MNFGAMLKIAEELALSGKSNVEIRQGLFKVKGAKVAAIASVMRVVEEMKMIQEVK
jgi:hypothetical protein